MADYGINIGVNVQSGNLTKLTQQLKELRAIEKDLARIQQSGVSTQKKVTDARRAAKDEINKNKKAALDAAKSFSEFTGVISKGSSALKEQSAQFRAYRQNVKFGRTEWTTFTQAIAKTDFTATLQSLKRLNTEAQTIANTFKLMGMGGAGPAFGTGASIQNLLTFKPANTTNALQAYSNVLENVIRQVDRGSAEYKELALRIAAVNDQLAKTPVPTANQYGAPIGPQQGPGFFQKMSKQYGGAISSGLIGGGFPLLFGQGGVAAAGGALGGFGGGLLGGGFGFGLSILGTAIGDAIQKNLDFNKALKDLNVTFGSAGNGAKILASDIDSIKRSLKGTREEALEAAQAFSFFGDTRLTTQFAKVFGKDAALAQKALEIRDPKSLQDAVEAVGDINIELGKELAQNVANLSIEKARALVLKEMIRLKKGEAAPTERVVTGTTLTRRGTRKTFGTQEILPQGLQQQALKDVQDFLSALDRLAPPETATTKADPTIALRQRLETVRGQIDAEEELLELQGRQTEVARMIYRENMAIVKAQADGVAERKKLKDANDIILSQEIEAGRIKVANQRFAREASELAEKTLEATKDLAKPLQDQLDQIKDKAAFEREYGELIRSGVVPAVAQQTIEINKQVKELERLEEKQLTEIDLRIETLQLLVDAVAGTEAEAEMQERLNKALERRNEIERKGEEARKAAREAQKTDKDRLEEAITAIQGQINTLMDPVQQIIGLASTLGDAFAESFKGIVSGSMTAREALANLFQRTADYFLDMAARMIAAQIKMQILNIGLNFFGGGGGAAASTAKAVPGIVTPSGVQGQFAGFAANGGPVMGGKSYIVGEKGPELFTPKSSGMITPNDALGAMGGSNIVVNVDAGGSNVQGDGNQAKALGAAIGAAVQAEIIKQKKPGGLLY